MQLGSKQEIGVISDMSDRSISRFLKRRSPMPDPLDLALIARGFEGVGAGPRLCFEQ